MLCCPSTRDHPRLRGEHLFRSVHLPFQPGSPPPTRGTQELFTSNAIDFGITPAYAGNTSFFISFSFTKWDHPRLRGEHLLSPFRAVKRRGSPPPTRGTPMFGKHQSTEFRITPAYAGNTISFTKYHHQDQDHPRLRGEHLSDVKKQSSTMGSPPPTRGTLCSVGSLFSLSGITPAYAGNTIFKTFISYRDKDHPRLRGEHHNKL